jgi:hypothetical protein
MSDDRLAPSAEARPTCLECHLSWRESGGGWRGGALLASTKGMDPKKKKPTPLSVEKDSGFNESHGYSSGHGGPSGPGDVPSPPQASPIPSDDSDEKTD